ncbi:MAG: nucleoside deaminase [Nanoarchaeota archaeon]|mgnify:FL=1
MFSEQDNYFMKLALKEAELTCKNGNLPVGAVLAIDGNFIGASRNTANVDGTWISHAELSLLYKYSSEIKKNKSKRNVLYTTWEPCLMCLGASVSSRINEIVYACPDPNAGASHLESSHVAGWYAKHWPKIREGPFRQESFNLLEKFMEENSDIWGDFLVSFREHTIR